MSRVLDVLTPSTTPSSQYERVLFPHPVEDGNAFLECAEPIDEENLREYQRLTELPSRWGEKTRNKDHQTHTRKEGGEFALAVLVLGGGFLIGGPLGFGVGALLLAGCYPVEEIGVAEQNDNESPPTEGETEGEGEIAEGTEAEGEAKLDDEVEPDSWTPTSTEDAPEPRRRHTAIWTGSEMIIWGGSNDYFGEMVTNTGGRYNPLENSWTPTNTVGAPSARYGHTAIWTGSEMIVWGGYFQRDYRGVVENTGRLYDPLTNQWRATSRDDAPSARSGHTAVWTDSEMIVWGSSGGLSSDYSDTGGHYNPVEDRWTPTSIVNAPSERGAHTAIWADSEMIVWGGSYSIS